MSTGFVNRAINNLPFELHIPGYQFCGPGTKLEERLQRGDRGINPLDEACRDNDIPYSRNRELPERHKADKILAQRARERITAKGASFGERAAATSVWAIMNIKRKLGMGISEERRRRKNSQKKKKKKPASSLNKLNAAVRRKIRVPSSVKKRQGGFLPLLPLLGAVGALAGGASGIAKAVNSRKASRRQLEEMQRHNRRMEELAVKGQGLYLAPYKRQGGRVGKVKRKK